MKFKKIAIGLTAGALLFSMLPALAEDNNTNTAAEQKTAEVKTAKQCVKAANTAYTGALKSALKDYQAAYKKAKEYYQAARKSAGQTYKTEVEKAYVDYKIARDANKGDKGKKSESWKSYFEIKKANNENRNASLKTARDAYLAAQKVARDAHQAAKAKAKADFVSAKAACKATAANTNR